MLDISAFDSFFCYEILWLYVNNIEKVLHKTSFHFICNYSRTSVARTPMGP